MRCEEIRDLAAEIALGIADGEERAEALRHLSTCADCRRAVEELSEVADELLMLAPVQEPPAGFESRVVEAMGLREPPRRRRARWLSLRWLAPRVGPALATAAVTAVALVAVYHDDHQTAERYRATLAQANGHYFQAKQLTDDVGAPAGGVRLRGLPVVGARHGRSSAPRLRQERTARDEGRTEGPLPTLQLDRNGSWGGAIPVSLYKVASLRLLGERPGEILQASFPQGVSETN